MRRITRLVLGVMLAAWTCTAPADAIRLEDTWHEDVYVEASDRMYYVLLPETGRVLNAAKDDVAVDDLIISDDEDAREALRTQWQARHDALRAKRETPATQAAAPQPQAEAEAALTKAEGEVPTTLRLAGETSYHEAATETTPRPARAPMAAVRPVDRGVYTLGEGGTLPKIVVQSPSGALTVTGGYQGGFGMTGRFRGGAGAGFGGGGFGGGGFRGGGFGGAGGGFGGSVDVTAIGNISDLFTTIDDRLVGESPAPIPGLQMRVQRR